MPDPTTVWMVRLDRGQTKDIRGTLSLESNGLLFTDARSGEAILIGFDAIQKPKRVKGSPILLLTHVSNGERRRIAFYFLQPPPLKPPEPGTVSLPSSGFGERPLGPFGALRRTSKRRHMKTNIGYLTTSNTVLKDEVQRWVLEIGARLNAG
jgi:hypothetical protein